MDPVRLIATTTMAEPDPLPAVTVPSVTVVPLGGERLPPAVADPVTTAEQDRGTASQRAINLIWENTQMKVALSVIWVSLAVAFALAVFGKILGSPDIQLAAVVFLFGVANLVTGFYFGRTNHQRSGGIGGEHAGTR